MSTQIPEQGQQETEVVTGQVMHTITKGNGKWQIAVQPQGSQYTKNLWTKDYPLVQQMDQSINQWFSFVCGPSYWTMPDGKQVRSLWINSVTAPGQAGEPGIQGGPQQQGNQQPQQQAQGLPGISPLEKDERIMRQTAMKVAAFMLPHLKPEERNAEGMITIAEGMVAYFKLGAAVLGGQSNHQPDHPGAYDEPYTEDNPPAPGEHEHDDIPF